MALLWLFHPTPPPHPPAAVSQTLSTPPLRGLTFNRRGTECFHCRLLTHRSGWEGVRIVPTLNIKGSFVSASPSAKVRQMSANCGHTRHEIPAEHQLASKDTICFKLAAKLHSLTVTPVSFSSGSFLTERYFWCKCHLFSFFFQHVTQIPAFIPSFCSRRPESSKGAAGEGAVR